jgi:hypothetical protein
MEIRLWPTPQQMLGVSWKRFADQMFQCIQVQRSHFHDLLFMRWIFMVSAFSCPVMVLTSTAYSNTRLHETGASGLDGTDLLPKASRAPVTDKNPILAMRDALLAQPPRTSWLIATGALTNVGLLFATFPEVASHIKGLSVMGGAIGEGFTDAPMSRLPGSESRIGNTTPWAEFNIYVRFGSTVLNSLLFIE